MHTDARTFLYHPIHVASLFKLGQVHKGFSFGLWIRYLGLFLGNKSHRALSFPIKLLVLSQIQVRRDSESVCTVDIKQQEHTYTSIPEFLCSESRSLKSCILICLAQFNAKAGALHCIKPLHSKPLISREEHQMSNDIQTLLIQRKQQWSLFQQLRYVSPTDARAARNAAIDAERELLGMGFTMLT